MSPKHRSLAAATLIPLGVGALLLPAPLPTLTLAGLAVAWWRLAPRRRERPILAVFLLAAGLVHLGDWAVEPVSPDSEQRVGQIRDRYEAVWQELEALAERAAGSLAAGEASHAEAFSLLEEAIGKDRSPRAALLLLDRDAQAIAWAGAGLLHEPEGLPAARTRRFARAGFTATTLFVRRSLEGPEPGRYLVAGRSFDHRELPFRLDLSGGPQGFRWTVGGAALPTATRIEVPETPDLILTSDPAHPGRGGWDGGLAPHQPWSRLAWGLVGLGLLAVAALRLVAVVVLRRTVAAERASPGDILVPIVAGVGVLAVGAGVSMPVSGLLAAAAGFATAAFLWRARLPSAASFVLAGAGTLGFTFAAWSLRPWVAALDLGARVLGSPEEVALRVTLALVATGILCAVSGRREAPIGEGWGWVGALLVVGGAALHDELVPALAFLCLGASATAVWLGGQPSWRRLIILLPVGLLGSLLGASLWEAVDRHALRQELRSEILPQMAPPTAAETEEVAARLDTFFAELELESIVPRNPEGLETRDLAYAIWRHSPLQRRDVLSAIAVETVDGDRSSFSFGIPLRGETEIDPAPGRWRNLLLPVWRDSLVHSRTELVAAGSVWASIEYWLMLRPGFRLPDPGFREVGRELLRGGAAAVEPGPGLPPPARFALYDRHGESLSSPWEEGPPLPGTLRNGGQARVETPDGMAWAWARKDVDGIGVLYLPVLTPLAAMERVGTLALGALLPLVVAGGLFLLVALVRSSVRDALMRTLRSYSQRLLLVYSFLLLMPLLLLNVFVFREMEERLKREQESAGKAALRSAQRVIGEYVLALEPGFGVDTALDDELVTWLSRVVDHEINLYWGSSIYASSKPELFASGLLTRRIPGEIFARLSLQRLEIASRTNRTNGTEYLELYAPLRIPGISRREGSFFLSTPLLAQQEEAARELADIRRQVLLVTAALFLVLATVGTRLARSFTRPLMDLVEGTKRIAAGAPSLGVSPTVVELAALGEAIDRMAQKIAEGRARLVQEKALAEVMVNNINSAVVSLDRDGRILMRNRVAVELLGAEIGRPLSAILKPRPGMEAVHGFLRHVSGDRPEQVTVRIPEPEGGEREWTLLWLPLAGGGEPAALVVIEDVTDVLRAQRLQAWAEMARMIAHEVKNPLTPIRLSAEHLREVFRRDDGQLEEVFERCVDNILQQVGELQEIVSEFSAYSQIPRIAPHRGNLVEAVSRLVEGYQLAPPAGVGIELEVPETPVVGRFDERLLARAVRNLIENALRVSGAGDRIRIRVEERDAVARIIVSDSGPGVSPEILPRIFDPYFSTHDSGTGLGLPIARRIVEEHGGEIVARNRPPAGLEVTISLPLAREQET